MTILRVTRVGVSAAMLLVEMGERTGAVRAGEAQLDAMRQVLAKYGKPYVTIRDLNLSTEA